MRTLIGRQSALMRLKRAAAESPQLVVVRGRRRVGKSFLISHAFREDPRFVYLQADEGTEQMHLDLLAAECARLTGAPVRFSDWNAALDYLAQIAASEAIVLALDEFQWLWDAQSALPSTIMRHFDRWKRDGVPIALVIAGSAITLMERLVEGDQPLFGRADARLLIEPFDYRVAAEFGSDDNAADNLRRYAVLGGTAQYQAWAGTGSLTEVLETHILPPGEPLHDEPLQLLRGERDLREPGTYFAILRAIAEGRTQFNAILQAVAPTKGAALSARLHRLIELGYVQQRTPLAGNGTGSYSISDSYFRFWFRFIWPNRSRLQAGRIELVRDEILAGLDDFMGLAFEQACRQWARRYAPHGTPLASAQQIGSYWTRTHDIEIDVVAMTGQRFDALGSAKWSARADAHVLDRLRHQRDAIRNAGDSSLYIFARGFDGSLARQAEGSDVQLIRADDLYEP
ncbi:MAG: ATP-binding protein [Patulibacter sp.]